MAGRRRMCLWPDTLIRLAGEQFGFLVREHGFRQVNAVGHWYVETRFEGEPLTLSLTYGNKEADFFAEIAYAKFPRKNPKALWAVLEALGIRQGPVASETFVNEERLRELVAATASLVSRHWEVISREPTKELMSEVEKILDRYSRRIRRQYLKPSPRARSSPADAGGGTRRAGAMKENDDSS